MIKLFILIIWYILPLTAVFAQNTAEYPDYHQIQLVNAEVVSPERFFCIQSTSSDLWAIESIYLNNVKQAIKIIPDELDQSKVIIECAQTLTTGSLIINIVTKNIHSEWAVTNANSPEGSWLNIPITVLEVKK